ncbi:MAG TPA: DUF6510 family protein [Propionibacteriaceae bacterium]|nr:DUF6510 family protein [Propionibacteriaceae bacterium]
MNESPAKETAEVDPTAERRLDGNAVTGALAELFAVDLVPADCTCAHCGRTSPLAQYDLYADSPALVLRCAGCSGVVLRYSSAGGRIRLDMSGMRLLALRLPDQA